MQLRRGASTSASTSCSSSSSKLPARYVRNERRRLLDAPLQRQRVHVSSKLKKKEPYVSKQSLK